MRETADTNQRGMLHVAPSTDHDWWNRMSRDEQEQYLREHPRSVMRPTAQPRTRGRGVPTERGPARTRGGPTPDRPHEPVPSDGTTEAPAHNARGHLRPAPSDRAQWPEHIKRLALPPAWTDVHISPDPHADLQAIGRDAKGRSQYVYSAAFAQSQSAAKFERIRRLRGVAKRIARTVAKDRDSSDARTSEHADCASLVMRMGLRPGSDEDTGANKKAYGATTLRGSHVVRDEHGRTRLVFTGKKGVDLNLLVPDRDTADMLQRRARDAGPDGALFPQVSGASLSDYVHRLDNGGFKTKDFRTLRATEEAHRLVQSMPVPTSEREYKRAVRQVATHASGLLGNTPSVCLSAYICPSVFAPWHAARGDQAETAADHAPSRARLPLVHYGPVNAMRDRPLPALRDERDDDEPAPIARSVTRLLGVDPRELFAPRPIPRR